jgi:hypothetical protein
MRYSFHHKSNVYATSTQTGGPCRQKQLISTTKIS